MKVKLFILQALIIAGISTPALALDFSADVVTVSNEGSASGKIFVSGNKVRMEMPGVITIARIDQKVVWILMPNEMMYMEQSLDPKKVAGATEKMEGEIERVAIGPETIDGRAATKYKVVYDTHPGQATVFQWVDQATGVPIKTTSEDGSWSVEYKNIITAAPQGSLFEIPEGYAKFAMPNIKEMMEQASQTVEME